VFNEDAVKDSVLSAMLKAMGASADAQKDVLSTNIAPVTDKPAYHYGARSEQIHQNVRRISVATSTLRNIFISPPRQTSSWRRKGWMGGSFAEAQQQAYHDGG
jgi:hypothetical protein